MQKPENGLKNYKPKVSFVKLTSIWSGRTFVHLCSFPGPSVTFIASVHMGAIWVGKPAHAIFFSCLSEALISNELRFHDTTRNTVMDASTKLFFSLSQTIHSQQRFENFDLMDCRYQHIKSHTYTRWFSDLHSTMAQILTPGQLGRFGNCNCGKEFSNY